MRFFVGCVAWLDSVLRWLLGPGGLPLGCVLGPEWEGKLLLCPAPEAYCRQSDASRTGRLRPEDARKTSVVSF